MVTLIHDVDVEVELRLSIEFSLALEDESCSMNFLSANILGGNETANKLNVLKDLPAETIASVVQQLRSAIADVSSMDYPCTLNF
jgi:hypothetical protein